MHVRVVTRKNKDGTAVRYLQLTHNEWDAATKTSRPKVLHSFGREDQLDRAAIERLVASLCRLLEPRQALSAEAGGELEFVASRAFGGTYVLDAMWQRFAIGPVMRKMLAKTRRDELTERVLFALVANRALAPSSKLAATRWVGRKAHIDGLEEVSDDACYRAMDWLHEVKDELEIEVFRQVATLLNLEVDLLFFDTTSTYFETGEPDEPLTRDEHGNPLLDGGSEGDGGDGGKTEGKTIGFRTYGKSKDSRDDLPQIVIGMAVTRTGIPVRVWCWPGNTGDHALIRQVKDDMRDWTLARIMWVADRGFSSAENRRYLRRGDHHYIIGEKLRSDSTEIKAALSRQDRYTQITGNMRVKEVNVSDTERFIICHNPDGQARDAAIREQLVTQLEELIGGSDELTDMKRGELRGKISTKPGLNRFLRVTPGGLLRIDKKKIKTEANLDGKYLLRCSDPHLSPEEIAVGYKQLLEVERGWRDMKSIIDLRPVYHRLEERIRAHVILCWLALLLIRIIENDTDTTWAKARDELEQVHLGLFQGPAGAFRQRTQLTKPQRDLLAKLNINSPKKIIQAEPTTGH
jgi:hypothetical protein